MSTPLKGVGMIFALLLIAAPAMASWQAAELIIIPAVAQAEGAGASIWTTDLYFSNVDDVNVDIAMTYFPSGVTDNGWQYTDRSTWLGGREDQGFGFVNEALADIPPNGELVLRDVVGEYWLESSGLNGLGAMVIFVYESGTLEDDGTRTDALGIANARIYNESSMWAPDPDGHGFIEEDTSFGQFMPGVPWYNAADAGAVTEDEETDFSFMILTGAEESSDYRFNLGIFNASDPQTAITISIQPFQPNGERSVDDDGNEILTLQVVPPAAHLQFFRVFSALWGMSSAPPSMIKVSFVLWNSTSPDPVPLFVTYGSLVDDRSNDPSSVMGSFAYPFNVDCMFPSGTDGEGAGASARMKGEPPVQMPPIRGGNSRLN